MLRSIRLVIYDLDGTLIDSEEAIVETFNRVISELGEEECTRTVIEEMVGLPLTEMFRRVLPEAKYSEVTWCWERYREIYDEISAGKTRILPDAVDTLTHCARACTRYKQRS